MSKDEKIVHVFLNLSSPKVKVGILAYQNGKIFFEYDHEFLKTSLELSPYMLPLQEKVFEFNDSASDGLWGIFNDSIPNSLEQLVLDKYLKEQDINPLDITPLDRLCYIGDFTMGALSYECKQNYNNTIVKELDQITRNVIVKDNETDLIKLFSSNNSLSSEVDHKVPIQHHNSRLTIGSILKPLQQNFSQVFVKFMSPTDPAELGKIEYAYSLMAKDAKLERPHSYLIKNKYFAYKRFDYHENKRLHIHSVAGLIHSDIKNPTLDYNDLLALSLDLTKDIRELEKVFRVACFNLFSSNRDDHAKNFSFMMDENGIWKFAPSYNITFSNGLNGEHCTKYLGEGKNPTEKHLIELGSKHMLKNSKKIIKEVKASISKWSMFAEKVNLSDETCNLILGEIYKKLN